MIYFPGCYAERSKSASRLVQGARPRQGVPTPGKTRGVSAAKPKKAPQGIGLSYRYARSKKVWTTTADQPRRYDSAFQGQTRRKLVA